MTQRAEWPPPFVEKALPDYRSHFSDCAVRGDAIFDDETPPRVRISGTPTMRIASAGFSTRFPFL